MFQGVGFHADTQNLSEYMDECMASADRQAGKAEVLN
jgi:hypothetical protein